MEIQGMEEFTEMLQGMTIDEIKEKKAVREAIKPIASEIEKNTPVGSTGKLKKISKTVKKEGMATVGIIKTKAFYDMFQEFGTSQQKHNVGYFDRSVTATENVALEILKNELLK